MTEKPPERCEKSTKIRRRRQRKRVGRYNGDMKLGLKYREGYLKTLHRYQGRAVGFRADAVSLPDGKKAQREYMTHPGAVGVLPIDSDGKVIMVKQFRYPVGEFTLEIPAGKLSKGENPLHCVRRELEEEAGVRARKIKKLLSYWPTAAFSQEVIHIYFAWDLYDTHVNPDEDEFLEIVRLSPKLLERMIGTGKIRDSKTLIACLAWQNEQLRKKR